MKKVCSYLLCAVGMQLISAGASHAQETALALKSPATAVTIDGDNKEWGDSLSYYNADKKIHYTLASDKDNLYLVLKTNDPAQEANILSSGVTLAIDTKGRKKSTYTVTFPTAGIENMRRPDNSLEEKKLRAGLTKFRKIGVDGFKDINDEQLTIDNAFGIKEGITFDDKGYLIYEEAIPLDLFHAGDLAKNEWAFNIKLNAVSHAAPSDDFPPAATDVPAFAGAGRATGGRGGANPVARQHATTMPANNQSTESSKTIDFWGKFSLAKQ